MNGSFDSSAADKNWNFSEYNNAMYGDPTRIIMHWDNPAFPVKKTHYLYPLDGEVYSDDFMLFDGETGGLLGYEDMVQVVRVHSLQIIVDPAISRKVNMLFEKLRYYCLGF